MSTPESRIKELEAERDALAARLDSVRKLLPVVRPSYGAIGSRDVDIGAQQVAFDEIMYRIDTSDQILARRDAAIWMEAAEVCRNLHGTLCEVGCECAYELQAKADELLKGVGK